MARANGEITNGGGVPNNEFVAPLVHEGAGCAYYQGIQGTSMASPHVTGVAALIIGALGGTPTRPLVRQIIEQTRGRPRLPGAGHGRLHDRRPPAVVERHVHRARRRSTTSTATGSSTPTAAVALAETMN